MKNTFKIIFSAALLLLLASCEKELKLNMKQQKTSIVMFSLAQPGQELSVKLLQSASVLDRDYSATVKKGLPKAQVRAFINGSTEAIPLSLANPDDDHTSSATIFSCSYIPQSGDKIRIEADAEGFESVWAETSVPQEPDFQIISVRKEPDPEYDTYAYFYVKVCINDPAEVKNYYKMNVSIIAEWDGIFTDPESAEAGEGDSSEKITSVETDISICSKDPIFAKDNNTWISGGNADAVKNTYFTDSYFNGKSYTFEFYFNRYNNTKEIQVELQAMSKDLYDYNASLEAYYESDDFALFSEPVQILCNVENGIGCLGASASRLWSVEAE